MDRKEGRIRECVARNCDFDGEHERSQSKMCVTAQCPTNCCLLQTKKIYQPSYTGERNRISFLELRHERRMCTRSRASNGADVGPIGQSALDTDQWLQPHALAREPGVVTHVNDVIYVFVRCMVLFRSQSLARYSQCGARLLQNGTDTSAAGPLAASGQAGSREQTET